jgi:hypothetical protein
LQHRQHQREDANAGAVPVALLPDEPAEHARKERHAKDSGQLTPACRKMRAKTTVHRQLKQVLPGGRLVSGPAARAASAEAQTNAAVHRPSRRESARRMVGIFCNGAPGRERGVRLGRLGHPTSRDTLVTAARTVAVATRRQRDTGATGPSAAEQPREEALLDAALEAEHRHVPAGPRRHAQVAQPHRHARAERLEVPHDERVGERRLEFGRVLLVEEVEPRRPHRASTVAGHRFAQGAARRHNGGAVSRSRWFAVVSGLALGCATVRPLSEVAARGLAPHRFEGDSDAVLDAVWLALEAKGYVATAHDAAAGTVSLTAPAGHGYDVSVQAGERAQLVVAMPRSPRPLLLGGPEGEDAKWDALWRGTEALLASWREAPEWAYEARTNTLSAAGCAF